MKEIMYEFKFFQTVIADGDANWTQKSGAKLPKNSFKSNLFSVTFLLFWVEAGFFGCYKFGFSQLSEAGRAT